MKTPALIAVLISILCTVPAHAQSTTRHQIKIGAGVFANDAVVNDMLENFVRVLFQANPQSSSSKFLGNVSYQYQINQKLSAGAGMAYGKARHNGLHEQSNTYGYQTITAIMAFETSLNYKTKDQISTYGEVCFGNFITQDQPDLYPDQKYSNTGITFQITPIGIRYGKTLGAFAELGYGYKGIINLGLSSKF